MDIGKSFSYIFEDKDWLSKVLIGTLIFIISIMLTPILIGLLGFAIITGYQLQVIKNVRQGDPRPLPEWRDNWGEWMVLGIKLAVVVFVWSLPGILISIPSNIGTAMLDGNSDVQALGALLALCFGCLAFLWSIIVMVATPAIYVRMAETEELASGFQFGDIIAFTRNHLAEAIIAVIVYTLAALLLTIVGAVAGAILCIVGLVITLPAAMMISTLIQAHLFAQVGKEDTGQTVTAVDVPMPPAEPPASMPVVTEVVEVVEDEPAA